MLKPSDPKLLAAAVPPKKLVPLALPLNSAEKPKVPGKRMPEALVLKPPGPVELLPKKPSEAEELELRESPGILREALLAPLALNSPGAEAPLRLVAVAVLVNAYCVFSELAGVRVNEPLTLCEPDELELPPNVLATLEDPVLNSEPEMVCVPLAGPLSEAVEPPKLDAEPEPPKPSEPAAEAPEKAETDPPVNGKLKVKLKPLDGELAALCELTELPGLMMTSAGAGAIHSKVSSPARRNAAARPRWRAKPNKRMGRPP